MESSKALMQKEYSLGILSLNAANEASHLGDHGRGFAVISEEVKKLAHISNEAPNRIVSFVSNSVLSCKLYGV